MRKFWNRELEWFWPPTVPKKWRRFPSRDPMVRIERHAGVVPGAEVLLARLSPQQLPFALSVSSDAGPLAVSLLGPLCSGTWGWPSGGCVS